MAQSSVKFPSVENDESFNDADADVTINESALVMIFFQFLSGCVHTWKISVFSLFLYRENLNYFIDFTNCSLNQGVFLVDLS